MTRARDIGVTVIAIAAAFIALQGTPDVGIQLRWIIEGQATVGTEHHRMHPLPIPQPLVTDLDGDGRSEVVALSEDRMTVRILSIPLASGETLVDPVILHEQNIAPHPHTPGERHVVALAAGYLDPPQSRSVATSGGSGLGLQHLVVVREDWHVICYNHKFERVWKTSLPHMGSPTEGGSFVIDQVAITVTHATPIVDNQGRPNREANAGLVIVGASMRHRDGHHHHARAAQGSAGELRDDLNPLGVHVEPFVEGVEDSRDEGQAEITEEEKQRRAAEHFSMFRLDGATGNVVWSHVARAHLEDQSAKADPVRRPHYKLEELEDLSRPVDDQGGGSRGDSRRYRQSLLHLLPHAWSSPVDTRLEVAVLQRRGPRGRGTGGDGRDGGGNGNGRQGIQPFPPGRQNPSVADDRRGRAGVGGGGRSVKAVVARTREGLEAVELSTGKPLSSVTLPVATTLGAGGAYADLNGDGVVDHVQAVGTRGMEGWGHVHSGMAIGHPSAQSWPSGAARQGRRLPPCYALAVTGLPPREQLFNGSICHGGGALLEIGERLNKPNSRLAPNFEADVGASAPAVLSRGVPLASAKYLGTAKMVGSLAKRGSRSDVVFAVSSGVVSCYDDEGRLKWQDRRGPKWSFPQEVPTAAGNGGDDFAGGYVVPFTLRVDDAAEGNAAASFLAEERIIVVGDNKVCVYDRDGRLSGQAQIVSAPSQPPVVGDFDGDGIMDLVVLGKGGLAAGYVLAPDPGIRALFVAVLVLIGAMLVVAAVYVPPPSSSVRGLGWGGGRRRVVWKSKRATD